MTRPNLPAAVLDRLAKLLPLLASDRDGEVVATARAISRTLASAGSDFHALADIILAQPVPHSRPGPASGGAAPRRDASRPKARDPDAPEARATRWGLPIWGAGKILPWRTVAGHCLQLDWTIPKSFGGKFLTKAERNRLKAFERNAPLTNADAAWIETIVSKCHTARDAWRAAPKTKSTDPKEAAA